MHRRGPVAGRREDTPMHVPRRSPRARCGFTLIEILIVVAVMALLAGAAIPVASKALTTAARRATREELVRIGIAAQEYFRDTDAAPACVRDLEEDAGVRGWNGPYLPASASDWRCDAWSRVYRVKTAADVVTIASAGPDASAETADDVRVQVDLTPIRRERTRDELESIRQAIALYVGLHGSEAALPATWTTASKTLADAGFLGDAEVYANDGWGNPYVGDSEGRAPITRVISTSLATE